MVTTFVEDWLRSVEIAAPPPFVSDVVANKRKRPSLDHNHTAAMPSPPRSPSPSKRRRFDEDITQLTPRASAANKSQPETNNPSESDSTSLASQDDASQISQQSGRSSPLKREVAMRHASDLPLDRKPMKEMLRVADEATKNLLRTLSQHRIQKGIIPNILKSQLQSEEEAILDPIPDYVFSSESGQTNDDDFHAKYVHKLVQRICHASRECSDAAHPVHEAEWNDKVHSPLLSLALEAQESSPHSSRSVVYHNITGVRIAARFRDVDWRLKENKVDYGVFLAPASDSSLGRAITAAIGNSNTRREFESLHALETYEPDRPLAITMETKRNRGSDAKAPTQLANWIRAHFRAVRNVSLHLPPQLSSSNNDNTTTTTTTESFFATDPLVHPLIELVGSTWYLSFAVYQGDRLVIYSHLTLGSTEELTGCYQLLRSLECLLEWCRTECWAWWERLLEP